MNRPVKSSGTKKQRTSTHMMPKLLLAIIFFSFCSTFTIIKQQLDINNAMQPSQNYAVERDNLHLGDTPGFATSKSVSATYLKNNRVPIHNVTKTSRQLNENKGSKAAKITTTRTNSLTNILDHLEESIDNFQTFQSDEKYLIICARVNAALFPIFSNFTIIRLSGNKNMSDFPPWNATVFLDWKDPMPSFTKELGCDTHPYVVEAMRRRRESPYLVASLDESSGNRGVWRHGVHWPNFSSDAKQYLRAVNNRPIIMDIRGEVFWRNSYGSCSEYDFVVYRETENPGIDCLTIHFLQGVSSAAVREQPGPASFDPDLNLANSTAILMGRKANPYKPVGNVEYEHFCSFIVRYDSDHLVYMFEKSNYDIDAIVRHMFFRQLSKYKSCRRIHGTDMCPGTPEHSYKCMKGHKFHISMENTMLDGYITEKLFNGALGGGVPIFFGAGDIASYINMKSIVHCNVSKSVIEEMRSFYPRKPKNLRRFTFQTSSPSGPTDEELLTWADGYLLPQLDACVKKVIELDRDDVSFRAVLDEPFIVNPDIMSGVYPLRGVSLAYNTLVNWKTIPVPMSILPGDQPVNKQSNPLMNKSPSNEVKRIQKQTILQSHK